MNKETAIEYFHALRKTIPFKRVRDSFGGWCHRAHCDDMFLYDCLVALHSLSDAGVAEFTQILSKERHYNDATKCVADYNKPKSPVRNFLLRCWIDYPLD